MLNPGKLRHKLYRQLLTETPDSYGQLIPQWVPQEIVFGYVETLSGREAVNAQQVRAESTHKITLRYLEGLSAKDRFIYDGRYYNLLFIKDIENRKRWFEVLAQEVVSGPGDFRPSVRLALGSCQSSAKVIANGNVE